MAKLTHFLFATAMISIAAVVVAIHPQGDHPVALAFLFLLLAALIGAGIFAFRSRNAEQRSRGKSLSPTLATLSSAAILSIYAAGYHRTSTAGGFSEESSRRSAPVAIASAVAVPPSSHPEHEPADQGSRAQSSTARSAGSQSKNHPAKSAHVATGMTSASPIDAPVEYTAAAPVAQPASASANSPAQASAASQISDSNVQRAAAVTSVPSQPKASFRDGSYSGWGSCRHGDIQASVTIQGGKIASVAITQCLTRYSCSWISDLPNQVVTRQSPEVDYVSGASQSTDAFYGAVASALSKARN
jgi:uncharacterized protein with FMN-binding domain